MFTSKIFTYKKRVLQCRLIESLHILIILPSDRVVKNKFNKIVYFANDIAYTDKRRYTNKISDIAKNIKYSFVQCKSQPCR